MDGCESWTIKKAERQRTDDFELRCWRRLLRYPWTIKRSNQSILNIHWKTNAEASILWPPDAKSQLIGKGPDPGENWGQEEKGVTEDEMVGWHHRLNCHEYEQTPGDSEAEGSLVHCSPRGRKESDKT